MYSLPLFRHDPSIFELSIKSIPAQLQSFLSLLLTSLILPLKYSSSRFIMLQDVIFTKLVFVIFSHCTYQFLCLFHNVAIVLQIISTCMNYHNVKIFTYGWVNVVSHVLRLYPRMRSTFN